MLIGGDSLEDLRKLFQRNYNSARRYFCWSGTDTGNESCSGSTGGGATGEKGEVKLRCNDATGRSSFTIMGLSRACGGEVEEKGKLIRINTVTKIVYSAKGLN